MASRIPNKKWYGKEGQGHIKDRMNLREGSWVSLDIIKIIAKLQQERLGLHIKIYFLTIFKCWPCSRTGCQDLLRDFVNGLCTFLSGWHNEREQAR